MDDAGFVQPADAQNEMAQGNVDEELTQRSASGGDFLERKRTINIQIGKRALIVRATPDVNSEVIGQLLPGQLATVIEEHIDRKGGNVRACVKVDDSNPEGHDSTYGKLNRLTPRQAQRGNGNPPRHFDFLPPLPVFSTSSQIVEKISELTGSTAVDGSAGNSEEQPPPSQSSGGKIGWITLVKDGKKLVTSRVRMHAASRQEHMNQWNRRLLNDRLRFSNVRNEIATDPTGTGFAFGGVDPGWVHSRGHLHDVHKVHFSIGVVGRYLLHVRLRQAAMPFPGSPFTLNVVPGKPHAKAKALPLPADGSVLRGTVGTSEEPGCQLLISTADKMGNDCVEGGADVKVTCDREDVETSVKDQNDGTYMLEWRSKLSGLFAAHVTINGEAMLGSPAHIKLTSSMPELSKSSLLGTGLHQAVAGDPASFKVAFVDQYGNDAIPGEGFNFGMAIVKEKEKMANAKAYPFEGQWVTSQKGKGAAGAPAGGSHRDVIVDDEQLYQMTYVAKTAGHCDLHVWCDPQGKGERIALPGSPFSLSVQAGKASARVSVVDGWTKESRGLDKHGKAIQSDSSNVVAGDSVILRPMVLDDNNNNAVLPQNAFDVIIFTPDGKQTGLAHTPNSRGGVTTYDVRYECTQRGTHKVNITLRGEPIKNSPVIFDVDSASAEPGLCKLTMPKEPVLYSGIPAIVVLETFDKYGNRGSTGGLPTAARLQLMKQGLHDQTMLMPNNHSLEITDNNDGTYDVALTVFKIAANIRMIVNMDKNIPAAGGELPAVMLNFVRDEAIEARAEEERLANAQIEEDTVSDAPAAAGAKGSNPKARAKLKKAGEDVIAGLGKPEDRRKKDAGVAAVEAFVEGVEASFKSQPSNRNP